MTKRGCGLAMDDAGDYRYTRRRRAITVAVSVVATVALCVGYAVADMCYVAPGVLTLRHVEHSTVAAAGRSIEAADVIADIDASKTIDPAA
ncbi:MAG: D-alanyl-D-alanine carboxypeptidase, partial [Bifidobacterium adolescentis]